LPSFPRPPPQLQPACVHHPDRSSSRVFLSTASARFRHTTAPLSHGSRSFVSLRPPWSAGRTSASFAPSSFRFSRSVTTMTPNSADHALAPNGTYSSPHVHVLSAQIEKPELDDRKYRLIRLLDNRLEVLLVQDPKTEKSSAAMDVHVGHLNDPKDFPGLAHALEHCLFMGTSIPLAIAHLPVRHQKISTRRRLP
jgi:Insulinase (Peptidase family M16)